jgi:MarR family 2-MHQ and catechol resistance regulon transcriptional repressor
VSKLVGRMARRGLLERLVTDSNNRATFAILTEAGRNLQESVRPIFLAAVETYFSGRLNDGDLGELSRLFGLLMAVDDD